MAMFIALCLLFIYYAYTFEKVQRFWHLYNQRYNMWSSFCGWPVNCTMVVWTGWWRHVFRYFIMHIHLTKLVDPGTYRTSDTNLVSILYLVCKLCLNHMIAVTSLLVTLLLYYHLSVIQLSPQAARRVCFNLNKTIVMIKHYGLSKQKLLYSDIGKKLKNILLGL